MMELAHLEAVPVVILYKVVNKLLADKTQNLFALIAGFMKYSWNKLD